MDTIFLNILSAGTPLILNQFLLKREYILNAGENLFKI